MSEVVVASKMPTLPRWRSSAASLEVATIDQAAQQGFVCWTVPARLEIAGWSSSTLSPPPRPSNAQAERRSIVLPGTRKEALPASSGTDLKTEVQSSAKAKRAGKSRYDWEDVAEFIRNLLKENGELRPWDVGSEWQGQADVERAVTDYMEKHGGAPAESTVRLHVRKILTEEGR
jgi:hypothetical protein